MSRSLFPRDRDGGSHVGSARLVPRDPPQ
jgi:hypothetical protein